MLPILTITLNPALDISSAIDRLEPQRKLRCTEPRVDAGGGGVNVSRAIRELGGESTAFVVLAGNTGAELRSILERSGIGLDCWSIAGDTRSSFTVMERDTALHYRFVLPGPRISPAESDAILDHLGRAIERYAGYVVASGSLAPGMPDDFYARLAARTRDLGARMIIDTHGIPLRLAAKERPYLIRCNHLEAQELLGGDTDRAAHELGRQLVAGGLCEAAIVTIGEGGAIVTTAAEQLQIRPPKVTMHSSVGAGDSFVAALTFGLASSWPLAEAARFGVAAAADAVTKEGTQLCQRASTEAYFAQIGGRLQNAA